MKKPLSIIILILIICGAAMAQAPQGIPYQATARNSSGAILASTAISVRFSIRDSIATGTITYRETHSVTTTAQGMFSVNVGQGTPLIGTFSGINWGTNAKFMQVEMDPTGGSSYVDMGTQQMMSVPYSIYSSSAGNGLPSANNGDILYYNGSNWTKLPAGNEGQVLKMCGGLPTWGPCVALISTRDITGEISSLGINSGGSISSDGGSPVSGRGIVWDSNPNPTIALSTKTSDGTGTGDFYSSITGLSSTTPKSYYVRAYATNSSGTSYGNQIVFRTSIPSLTTSAPMNILGPHAFYCGGNIVSDSGYAITSRGVVWSNSPNPTIALSTKTNDGTGTGEFSSYITGLSSSTTYYVRAYATNSAGTSYGSQFSFTTDSATFIIGSVDYGGIIAYILQPGDIGYVEGETHGIVAATNDQASSIAWWNGSNFPTGSSDTTIGSGNANTNNIVEVQGNGWYAAKLCYDLILNGYNDWYMPSLLELNKLYVNRHEIGGFTSVYYWSSSESPLDYSSYAYIMRFDFAADGSFDNGAKGWSHILGVRAIRSF